MKNYTLNLIKTVAENNKRDEPLVVKTVPLDSNKKVLDLIANEANKSLKNSEKTVVSK